MIKQLIAGAALAGIASLSHAAEPAFPGGVTSPFYVGLDAGSTKVSDTSDSSRSSYGAFAGYTLNSTFAVEAGFRRLYSWSAYGAHEHANQASLSLIGTLPLSPSFGLYGRLGVNQLSIRGNWSGPGGNTSQSYDFTDRTTHALLGVGLSYKISDQVSARVEVQRPHPDLTNYSAGISYAF